MTGDGLAAKATADGDHGEKLAARQARPRDAVVSVQGLTKRYGQLFAVDNVTVLLEAGTVTGFLGPPGAGTTTSGAATRCGRPSRRRRTSSGASTRRSPAATR